jgi:hypothetical protein
MDGTKWFSQDFSCTVAQKTYIKQLSERMFRKIKIILEVQMEADGKQTGEQLKRTTRKRMGKSAERKPKSEKPLPKKATKKATKPQEKEVVPAVASEPALNVRKRRTSSKLERREAQLRKCQALYRKKVAEQKKKLKKIEDKRFLFLGKTLTRLAETDESYRTVRDFLLALVPGEKRGRKKKK